MGSGSEPSSSGAATYLLSGKPAPDGLGRCLGAGGDAEPIEHMLCPALDARLAPSQLDADLVIAGPGGHSAQDLNVLLAQAYLLLDLRCAQLRELAQHAVEHLGADEALAAVDRTDGPDKHV